MNERDKPSPPEKNRRAAVRASLLLLGLLFLGFGVVLLLRGAGATTVTTTAPTPGTTQTTVHTTTASASAGTPPAAPEVITTVKTTGGGTTTKVKTEPAQAPRGSDSLDVFVLGYGAILLLFAAFFDRIKKIDFPGGGGFELSPDVEEEVKAKIKAKKPEASDPELAAAYRDAFGELAKLYWGKRAKPPPGAVDEALQRAG